MSLTIVALILFLAMVAAWVVLPSGTGVTPMKESSESVSANAVGQTA